MVWCHPNYSLEDSAAFVSKCAAEWEKGEQYSFVIFDVSDGAFLGSVGLSGVNRAHKFANLGYWVRTKRTQQGVASAATCLIARFALEELRLIAWNFSCRLETKPASGLLKRLGPDRKES
jgi:RimJ/RimL family protein N-acetyltransferase